MKHFSSVARKTEWNSMRKEPIRRIRKQGPFIKKIEKRQLN